MTAESRFEVSDWKVNLVKSYFGGKKIEEKKHVDAVLANINDNDPSPDNLPIANTPTVMDNIDQTPQAQQEDTNDSISRPSSGLDQSSSGLDQQPSSPAEISQDRIQSSPASTSERESTKSPSREASAVTATIPTPEADPVPDSMVRFMGSLQEMTDTSGALGARPKNKDVKINDSGDKNNLVSGQSLTATVSKSPRKDEVRSAVARGYGLTQAVLNSKAVFYVDTMVANDLPTIIILDPYNNKVAHYMSETRPRLYRVEFCPTKLGTHTVVVTQGGKKISESPFKCEVFDPKSVRVTDIGPMVLGSECSLTVDVADAGHGTLSVMVKTSGQEVKHSIQVMSRGQYQILYYPELATAHKVDIMYNGLTVADSPIVLHAKNPATGKEPTATGLGLYQARVEKQTSFIIETLGVTAQAFDIFVTGPSNVVPPNEAIPVRCYQQKDKNLLAEFKPHSAGPHKIEVLHNREQISGSPFECQVYDPSKVLIVDPFQLKKTYIIGEAVTFTVDASQAGEGMLEVVVTTCKSSVRAVVTAHSRGQYEITFVPQEAITHYVKITFNEEDLLPLKCSVIDPMSVRPVVGWENLVDKKTNQIEMKPGEEKQIIWDIKEAGPGEFRMNVEGPAWSSNTRMLPLQKVRTVFEPTVIGKYTLQVTFSSVPVKFLHVNVAEEAVSLVPKDLQCPFCMDILSAAVLLPCCVVAACYECSRNMLIESDLKCSLCFEDNISLDHLIPNPQIRKKVAEFKTKGKEETQIKLQPLPKLLSSNRVLPAEIMLQRQKEVEEEKKLVDAVLTNINGNDLSPDNLPLADTPTEIDDIDQTVCDYLNTNVESTAIQSPQAHQEDTNDSISRPSSGLDQSSSGLDQQPSSPAEISQDRIQSKSASPMVQSQSSPASTSERESTKSPSREASTVTATILTPEAAPVPDSTARFMGSLQEMTDTSGASGARPNKKDVKINDSGDIRTRSNFEEVQSFNPSLILPTDACYDIYKQRKNSKEKIDLLFPHLDITNFEELKRSLENSQHRYVRDVAILSKKSIVKLRGLGLPKYDNLRRGLILYYGNQLPTSVQLRQCPNCFKFVDHTAVDCPSKLLCHKCYKPGHFSRNCPNDVSCFLCGSSGHKQQFCRNIKK